MKKILYGFVALALLAASFGGGWATSQATTKRQEPSIVVPKAAPVTERFVDKSSGEGMSPSEMYAELGTLKGARFDSQYLAYVILMQNNVTGMNRLAKEKSENQNIKSKATQLWQADLQTTTELYNLQRSTGYAHH